MICKNCGTTFSTDDPDENGIVVCPECGKKYRKKIAVKPADASESEAQANETAATASDRAASPFQRFMRCKIGGMLPAWCACFVLVFVAVLLIVTLLSSGTNIEGSWQLVNVNSSWSDDPDDFIQYLDSLNQNGIEVNFSFEKDRFALYLNYGGNQSVSTWEASYRTKGNTLYLAEDSNKPTDFEYSVSGNKLTLREDERSAIFQRK